MGLLLQSRAILEDLSKATKESVYVAIRKGSAIIPLDFVEPARSVRVVSFLGTVLPSHCTAAGKVHLVFRIGRPAGQDLAGALGTLHRENDRRSQHVARAHEPRSANPATRSNGANLPKMSMRSRCRFAITPARSSARWRSLGPGHRLTDDAIHEDIAPLLLRAGAELSKRLGFPG